MKRRVPFLILLLALGCAPVCAQDIRGTVTSGVLPVADATVSIGDGLYRVVTDTSGTFALLDIPPGRYLLEVRHVQYETYSGYVQVSSAKDLVVLVDLDPLVIELDEVTVTELRSLPARALYSITEEETRRYPGTFFDPARFAATFPGAQVVNDQANQLIVRGLHPDLMQWHLEGLEILNPNHLANAGTSADRPTLSGGGVNMLSNQVLSNSAFLGPALPGYQGNTISGIMDMHFREGNSTKHEHTAQVGLLGIEAASEGPFCEGSESSYLVNARYSTVGLITALGVDFGDEAIQFADLSFSTRFDLGGGSLKLFGFGGFNTNRHEPLLREEWDEDIDFKDIDYRAGGGTLGFSWSKPFGKGLLTSFRMAYSRNGYDRSEFWPADIDNVTSDPPIRHADESGTRTKVSALAILKFPTGRTRDHMYEIAVAVVHDRIDIDGFFGDLSFTTQGQNTLIRPHLRISGPLITKDIGYEIGLGASYYANSQMFSLEPALKIDWRVAPRHVVSAGARITSQALNDIYFSGSTEQAPNTDLDPATALHVELSYTASIGKGVLQVTAFYHDLWSLPSSRDSADFSPLDLNPLPFTLPLEATGAGSSYGAAAGYRRNMANGYFANTNLAVFKSRYKPAQGGWRSTTFDTDYTVYISGGKEWSRNRGYGLRSWGLTAGYAGHGGLRHGDIDPAASEASGFTRHTATTAASNDLSSYHRVDVRIYLRKDKAHHASTWSLDIQNLLNFQNAWLPAYDFLLRAPSDRNQLGIIPVLSYRIDF